MRPPQRSRQSCKSPCYLMFRARPQSFSWSFRRRILARRTWNFAFWFTGGAHTTNGALSLRETTESFPAAHLRQLQSRRSNAGLVEETWLASLSIPPPCSTSRVYMSLRVQVGFWEAQVPVTISRRQSMEVVPSAVEFGLVECGRSCTRKVRVSSDSAIPFAVTAVRCAGSAFQVTPPARAASSRHWLEITFEPGNPGLHTCEIEAALHDRDGTPPVKLNVTGTGALRMMPGCEVGFEVMSRRLGYDFNGRMLESRRPHAQLCGSSNPDNGTVPSVATGIFEGAGCWLRLWLHVC